MPNESPRLPAGITVQHDPDSLVIQYKDPSGRGYMFLPLLVMLVVPMIIYGWGTPIDMSVIIFIVVVALGIGAILYAAIGMLINTTTISLADEVLLVKTRPLPFKRIVLLSASGITEVEVEKKYHSGSRSSWVEYAVIVTHEAVGRKKLIKFRNAERPARFIHELLTGRLGLGAHD